MESVELKPCPFCGGPAEIEQYGDRRQSTIVSCTECACVLENGETFRHGTIWNDRAPESAKDATIKRLVDVLTEIRNMTDADNEESYRVDDREGCLDTVHATAARAIKEATA